MVRLLPYNKTTDLYISKRIIYMNIKLVFFAVSLIVFAFNLKWF
ncbi:MAG: hypothetical protein V1494_05170 [Candidatus Diapherotrites archaeon]